MTKTKIKIQLGEYLSEVLPNGMMPSNVVINKHQCGLGITYSEIKAPRHSLIICPYTALAESKAAKHGKEDNLFAVVKGVTTDMVEEYIITTLNHEKYMKLITVPEDLYKVEKACHSLGINICSTFFVFIDECQHPVSDADWRKAMLTPLNLFFNAAQKAMASATPLGMSDPRFEDQHFTMLNIEPEYTYRVDTELYTTNNVLQTIKYVMQEISELPIAERSYYVFCKSLRVIIGLIKSLGVEDSSAIFCSEESCDRAKREYKFKKAYSTFSPEKASHFNFMTFRFADGIDIENLGEKPIVMVVTDVYSSPISWVNPSVDPYQIHGRFREGTSKFIVISNYSDSFTVVSSEMASQILDLHQNYYLHTKSLMQTENNPTLRNAYAEILNALPFAELVDEDGNPSSFLCDNHIESLVTKGCYNNHHTLAKAYELNSEKYNLQFIDQWWPIGDYEYLKLQSPAISGKEKRKLVVDYLKGLEPIDSDLKEQAVDDLRKVDADTVEAYFELGAEKMAELKYNRKDMKEAVVMLKYHDACSSVQFINLIDTAFPVERWYSLKYIKNELKRIHSKLGIHPPKAITASTIKDFFYTTEKKSTINGKQEHGYFLHQRK